MQLISPPRFLASQNSQNIANPSTSVVNVVCVAFLLFKAIEHLHGFAKTWRADFYVCPTKWLNALPLSHKTHILTDHKKKELYAYRNGCVNILNTQMRVRLWLPTGLNQQRAILSVFRNLMSICSITHLAGFLSAAFGGNAFIMGCSAVCSSCSKPPASFLVDRLSRFLKGCHMHSIIFEYCLPPRF